MTGDPMTTWDVLDWLRCPIIIRNEAGVPVWWGFVEGVEVGVGAISIGARIDTLSNRIAVAYTENTGAGSQRQTTAWSQDLQSIGTFGTKELLLSQADLNAASAEAYRNAQLSIRKIPQSTINPGSATRMVARITGRGWYSTIGWKYFARSQGRYAYTPGAGVASGSFAFGVPAITDPDPLKAKPAYLKVAQQFWATPGGWDVSTVKFQIRKVGNPTEPVRLSLWSNHPTFGTPQTELRVATVAASAIGGTGGDWVTFTLSPPWPVDASNVYWLVLERSGGSPSATNYYTVQGAAEVVSPPGYPIFWDGTTWTGFIGTVAFILEGVEETHIQMGAIIDASDQFISGYRVTDINLLATVPSGVFSNPYRYGDTTALAELTALLDVGNSAGFRYLATLDVTGFLMIYPEPVPLGASTDYTIDRNGTLYDRYAKPIDPSNCPVGRWVNLQGVLPKNTNINALTIPPAFFIESSTYNALTGTLDLTPRGAAGLADIGRIRQG
jgi:hypothetical protein